MCSKRSLDRPHDTFEASACPQHAAKSSTHAFHATEPECLVEIHGKYGGFDKIRGTILGVPIIRIMMFWGL